MTLTDTLRTRPDAIRAGAGAAAEALDGSTLGLGEGILADLVLELESLDGPLALVLDRLATQRGRPDAACDCP
jgi:hypothetical protein